MLKLSRELGISNVQWHDGLCRWIGNDGRGNPYIWLKKSGRWARLLISKPGRGGSERLRAVKAPPVQPARYAGHPQNARSLETV